MVLLIDTLSSHGNELQNTKTQTCIPSCPETPMPTSAAWIMFTSLAPSPASTQIIMYHNRKPMDSTNLRKRFQKGFTTYGEGHDPQFLPNEFNHGALLQRRHSTAEHRTAVFAELHKQLHQLVRHGHAQSRPVYHQPDTGLHQRASKRWAIAPELMVRSGRQHAPSQLSQCVFQPHFTQRLQYNRDCISILKNRPSRVTFAFLLHFCCSECNKLVL